VKNVKDDRLEEENKELKEVVGRWSLRCRFIDGKE
jgi:hypothetical protein